MGRARRSPGEMRLGGGFMVRACAAFVAPPAPAAGAAPVSKAAPDSDVVALRLAASTRLADDRGPLRHLPADAVVQAALSEIPALRVETAPAHSLH